MGTGMESAGEAGKGPVPEPSNGRGSPGGSLALHLLGGLEVRRGGERLPLPRSRKCRALIAYLALAARPQRREHLCELLWEVPDDPKGELRWTLSKIRRVLGDALIADRDTVAIDRAAVSVDAAALREAAQRLERTDTETLERLAGGGGEAFGEDIDVPRSSEFQSWLLGVREDLRRARQAVLGALVQRLREEPERAIPFARMRAASDPLDEGARLELIGLLAAAGRLEEAEGQRRLAADALRGAGIAVPAALARPVRRPDAASTPVSTSVQRIQFCTAPDGVRIAYSAVGSGPLLVKTANWMSHLEYEFESPLLRHWMVELSKSHRLVRYDARGNGLSDRDAADLSLEAFVQDLETVTGELADDSFDLIGISQGCAVAIAFAARHPERVRRMVLFGGFATGWHHSSSEGVHARWEAMITLAGLGWGNNNPAFRQMFTSLFAPRAAPEQADWFNELQRVSASPDEAQRLLRAVGAFDVAPLLSQVRAPTLVLHCRDDALVPFASGRHLATNIPGAQFVGLDSENHLPLADEPAWAVFAANLREFLAR